MDENIKSQIEKIRRDCEVIKPLVVIRCITYNHKDYIRDALDGFVNQKTSFPYVAIVHDDASTDGTAEIIQEYAKRYPDIIKPIYETENQYSKHDGSLGRIVNGAAEATGASYIALCEGDDYWIDLLKLQKQFDFLYSHPDYSMCFHGVKVKQEGTSNIGVSVENVYTREYSAEDLLGKWTVPTCSAIMRIDCIINKPYSPEFIVGDNVLWANCLTKGRVWGFSEVMGVYRRVLGGWTEKAVKDRNIRYNNYFRWIKHYRAMIICFPKIDRRIFESQIVMNMGNITVLDIFLFKKEFFKNFHKFYSQYKVRYLQNVGRSILKVIKSKLKK